MIGEHYKGFSLQDHTNTGLRDKRRKVDRGDTDGFIRVPESRVDKLEKDNAELTDKLSDYQQDMAGLAGENEALVAVIDEILYDLLESNPIMSVYWRKKTLHLRKKEGGEG